MMFRRPAEYNYYLHHLLWRHPLRPPTVVLAIVHSNCRSLLRNTEVYNELLQFDASLYMMWLIMCA
jgi:hypothetical protein